MANEDWRPVVGFDGRYDVSSLGRVRNVRTGHIKKSCKKLTGEYRLMSLCPLGGRSRAYSLHRIVASAFLGPCPEGLQCAHLNGDPSDNRAANLAYVTAKQNNAHKHLHGTAQHGERHHAARLTNTVVLQLRQRARDGEDIIPLAKEFGFERSAVCDAIVGRTWRHLPGAVRSISRTKLTEDDVRHIRQSHGRLTSTELAGKYGVTRSCIKNIWYGKTFARVI